MQGLTKSLAFAAGAKSMTVASARPQPGAQTRHLITSSALNVLRGMQLGEAALAAFHFPALGERVGHSRVLAGDCVAALKRRGLAVEVASSDAPFPRLGVAPDPRVTGAALRPEDVVRQCATSGPVRLIHPLPAESDQAASSVGRHRGVVVLTTFKASDGATIAVLLDGDDRQDNNVMRELKAWMAASKDTRALCQLTAQDFDAFAASRRGQGGSEEVGQLAFRFVKLDDLLAAKPARNVYSDPPRLPLMLWDRRVQALKPVLSEKQAFCLEILVDQDPGLVEQSSSATR